LAIRSASVGSNTSYNDANGTVINDGFLTVESGGTLLDNGATGDDGGPIQPAGAGSPGRMIASAGTLAMSDTSQINLNGGNGGNHKSKSKSGGGDGGSGEFDSITGAFINPDKILAPVYDYNGDIGVTLVAALPGDANLDGTVNGDDLLRWQANLFSGDEFIQGDFNLDGTVNGGDLLIWQSHLFDSVPVPVPATTPIPEPGTAAVLMSLGVLSAATRRRA